MAEKAPFRFYIYGILGLLGFIGIVVWIVWIIISNQQKDDLLAKTGQITIGKVLKVNAGYRSREYAVYEFFVNRQRYVAESKYSLDQKLIIGNKYEVIYYPPDPAIHRINFKTPIREPVKMVPLDSLTLDSIFQRSLQQY